MLIISDFYTTAVKVDLASLLMFGLNTGMSDLAGDIYKGVYHYKFHRDIDAVALQLGAHQVHMSDTNYMYELRELLDAIASVTKNNVKFLLTSITPFPEGNVNPTHHKNWLVRKFCQRDKNCYYVDLYGKLQVQGEVPPHFFDESDLCLNTDGFRQAVVAWGHRLAAIFDLWCL